MVSQNNFKLNFTEKVEEFIKELAMDNSKKAITKAVEKSLRLMESNLRHPSLNTHKYDDFIGPNGEEIFESYAQNNTPGAYRIFWYYGPGKKEVTVMAISPHP